MSNATGEFEIASLSKRSIRLSRSDTSTSTSARKLLTEEVKPLEFTLRFADGASLAVSVQGSGWEPSSWWRTFDAIKRLTSLPTDWDSYGGESLDVRAVRRSLGLFPVFVRPDVPDPTVVPTRNGGLQFEWHRAGIDLEIKVSPTGPITYFVADANAGTELEWEGAADREEIQLALTRLAQAS